MFLLHLVLAGVLIGALASNYDAYYPQHHQNREHQGQRKNQIVQRLDTNEINKPDSFADWIVRPRSTHQKFTSGTHDSRLDVVSRRSTTEETGNIKVKTTIPINSSNSTSSKVHVNPNAPLVIDRWPSDLKAAVEKLSDGVDNLLVALKDVKIDNNPELLNYMHPRPTRTKRDAAKTNASAELTNANATTNASAPDGGRKSNDFNAPEFQNGRRSGHSFKSVKEKLLLYLDEGFQEIGVKVNSLRKIKQQFANVAPYKIGYIVANVDTLAVSIKNLGEEARRNRHLWQERDILDVYDRLKISNSLITNLMETLRVLVEDIQNGG